MRGANAKSIARFGILLAMMLVLGYFEQLIPVAPGLPGVKLGLANTVLLYAVYMMNKRQAALLMLLKVTMSALLYSGTVGAVYALSGGILSLAAMLLLKQVPKFSIIGVSVLGAVSHNIGQLVAAALMVNTRALIGYLPVLLVSGAVTGVITGVSAKYVLQLLEKTEQLKHKKRP